MKVDLLIILDGRHFVSPDWYVGVTRGISQTIADAMLMFDAEEVIVLYQ